MCTLPTVLSGGVGDHVGWRRSVQAARCADAYSRLRISAEQELFEVQQRFKALMDALPVGVNFSDDVTCEHIWDDRAQAQFEVGPQDNISASALDRRSPGRQAKFFREGRQVSASELPVQRAVAENRNIPPFELEVQLPNGRRWFAEASGAPIHDQNGNVIGGVAVTVDITERKHYAADVDAESARKSERAADRSTGERT